MPNKHLVISCAMIWCLPVSCFWNGNSGPHLLISSFDGVFCVPVHQNGSIPPESKVIQRSRSNPSRVQCDVARGYIYWVEENEKDAGILRASLNELQRGPEAVLKWQRRDIFSNEVQVVDAFAVDWITGNLYYVLRGGRRIFACDTTATLPSNNQCTELFGNQLEIRVGALALYPMNGMLYWTQSVDGIGEIVEGNMDGSTKKIIWTFLAPSYVAVHDSFLYFVYQNEQYVGAFDLNTRVIRASYNLKTNGKRLVFRGFLARYKDELHCVGTSEDIDGDSIFKINIHQPAANFQIHVGSNFTRITGLSVYAADAQVPSRQNNCAKGNPCLGICLLSGKDSFRCMCPGDAELESDGFSCREALQPVVVFVTVSGILVMRNGSTSQILAFNISNRQMTFDTARREILLFDHRCEDTEGRDFGCKRTLQTVTLTGQMSSAEMGPQIDDLADFYVEEAGKKALFQPDWLEYDWVGDNVYFSGLQNFIGLCSRVTLECDVIIYRRLGSYIKRGSAKFALEPTEGVIFFAATGVGRDAVGKRAGIWIAFMNGLDMLLIIPNVEAALLTIDYSSRLLFWVQVSVTGHWDIFHSDLDGSHVKGTTPLQHPPSQLRVAGNRLFWLDELTFARTTLLVVKPDINDYCMPDALCSHMCVPFPFDYMQCLCPVKYRLKQDGWTCECNSEDCMNKSMRPAPATRRRPSLINSSGPKRFLHPATCPSNMFRCESGSCLDLLNVCNGFPDCPDFSDEGKECMDMCSGGNNNTGCSYNCSRSPKGPICFCPPEQILADDNKTCILLQVQDQEGSVERWQVGGMATGFIALLLSALVASGAFKFRQMRRKLRNLTQEEIDEFLQGDPAGASLAPGGIDRALRLPYRQILSPNDITSVSGTVLGSGEFGIVHFGICKSEPVAIKTFKGSVDVVEFIAGVLAEVKIMAYLGEHENVVKFVGAEISEIAKRQIRVVTEFSPHGDLLHFLWKVASVGLQSESSIFGENMDPNHSGVTARTLYDWCEQIAAGMEYLTRKQVVHGDLAARNILVFKDLVVKVSDFGMSQNLYGNTLYQMKRTRKLPWRGASIELLISSEFSEGSDVWAFGVTVREVFTLEQTPYKGRRYGREFIQFLQEGNRLPKPDNTSEQTYKVMLECWDSNRDNRPNFDQLRQVFHDLGAAVN